MISMLLGRDNISSVCNVKEGKRIPEAFLVTHKRDRTRTGMVAVGVSTESINVETWGWDTIMISIIASEKQACTPSIFVSQESAQYWCIGQVATKMISRTFLCFL